MAEKINFLSWFPRPFTLYYSRKWFAFRSPNEIRQVCLGVLGGGCLSLATNSVFPGAKDLRREASHLLENYLSVLILELLTLRLY